MNPGITKTVKWLNELGFETCDSGDGETRDYECDRNIPYVVVKVEESYGLTAAARQICDKLRAMGLKMCPIGEKEGIFIQATFDPTNNTSIIEITNIDDRLMFGPKT